MMPGHSPILVFRASLEAAQTVNEPPRDLPDRGMAPAPIGIGKAIEQRRRSGGKRNLKMQRERVVVDWDHEGMRTKIEL